MQTYLVATIVQPVRPTLPPHSDVKTPSQNKNVIEVDTAAPMPSRYSFGLNGRVLVSILVTPVMRESHRGDEMNQKEDQANSPDPKQAYCLARIVVRLGGFGNAKQHVTKNG